MAQVAERNRIEVLVAAAGHPHRDRDDRERHERERDQRGVFRNGDVTWHRARRRMGSEAHRLTGAWAHRRTESFYEPWRLWPLEPPSLLADLHVVIKYTRHALARVGEVVRQGLERRGELDRFSCGEIGRAS